MNKHTPGPWQYSFEGGTVAFIVETDGTTVAKLSVTENSTAHSALPANARLIAAAPDLLAALQMICDSGCALSDEITSAMMSALWKAESKE